MVLASIQVNYVVKIEVATTEVQEDCVAFQGGVEGWLIYVQR